MSAPAAQRGRIPNHMLRLPRGPGNCSFSASSDISFYSGTGLRQSYGEDGSIRRHTRSRLVHRGDVWSDDRARPTKAPFKPTQCQTVPRMATSLGSDFYTSLSNPVLIAAPRFRRHAPPVVRPDEPSARLRAVPRATPLLDGRQVVGNLPTMRSICRGGGRRGLADPESSLLCLVGTRPHRHV